MRWNPLAALGLENESKGVNFTDCRQMKTYFLARKRLLWPRVRTLFLRLTPGPGESGEREFEEREDKNGSDQAWHLAGRLGPGRQHRGEEREVREKPKVAYLPLPGVGMLWLGLFLCTILRNLVENDSECRPLEVSHLHFLHYLVILGSRAPSTGWSSPAPSPLWQLTASCFEASLSKQTWTSLCWACRWNRR